MGTIRTDAPGSSGSSPVETPPSTPRSDGSTTVSRSEAAVAIQDILITPRLLNSERYGRLIEELGSIVRTASERSSEMRAASEELRVVQAGAARTLDELRARTESVARVVALIDQRLARGEALLARATEQVQRAAEAASRVEALALPDATDVERRIADAERDACARLASIASTGAETMEALVRDGAARALAIAVESARHEASTVAAQEAHRVSGEIALARSNEALADVDSRMADRERSLREALREQAEDLSRVVRAAAEDAADRATAHVTRTTEELTSLLARADQGARERSRHFEALTTRLSAIERLAEPETLDPIRALIQELSSRIEQAEHARAALTAQVDRAQADQSQQRPTSESPLAPDAAREIEARALEASRLLDERARAATAHAEALGAYLARMIGHAQQIGSALEHTMVRASRYASAPSPPPTA